MSWCDAYYLNFSGIKRLFNWGSRLYSVKKVVLNHEYTKQGGLSSRGQLKCDGTRAETKFRLSAKRTSLFKSAGASVQSTAGSRGVRISGSNVGYTMFRGSVRGTGYPLLSPVSPSLPLPCVTVCHHISTGLYYMIDCTSLNYQRGLGYQSLS